VTFQCAALVVKLTAGTISRLSAQSAMQWQVAADVTASASWMPQ